MLSGATAEPVGVRMLPYLALAVGHGPASTTSACDRLNAWFFRRRYPAAIAEPIVAGGFWSRGGADALRAISGERFVPRLAAYPGPTLIINGERDLPFRLFAPTFAAAGDRRAPGPPGRRQAPRQPRPARGVQRGRPAVRAVARGRVRRA